MSKRNKTEGSNWERECVKDLQGIFPNIVTSRSCNWFRDGEKVDLVNQNEILDGRLPFNFQCKSLSTSANYSAILAEMPDTPGIPNVILNKKTKKAGSKFMTEGKFAIMYLPDFYELLTELERLKRIEHEKSSLH